MPRPEAASYRLGEQTLREICDLQEALFDERASAVSASEVVRFAVRELHRKKIQRKRKKGIDSGNTSR